ncbi:MAG: hypothetical protein GTO13_17970 [Proteobacteria bacterium]|nr:hypothetical protein [Pseudomonadota bacterium]
MSFAPGYLLATLMAAATVQPGAEKFTFSRDERLHPLSYQSQPEQRRIPKGFRKDVL